MKADDLKLEDLFNYSATAGRIEFAGERAAIIDMASLGLLRKELFTTLGPHAARGVLTRFGYSQGWRTAESLEQRFKWDSEAEWRRAGGIMHQIQGLIELKSLETRAMKDKPVARGLWLDSYEAEQHLIQIGLSETPVCWSLAGYASGYLSRVFNQQIYCIESECVATGSAVCKFEAKPISEWSQEIQPQLVYYEQDCLQDALRETRDTLLKLDKQLRIKRAKLELDTLPNLTDTNFVVVSEAMKEVINLVLRVAKVDVTVLISGESGVGKERVARLLHDSSLRASGPFIAVNCGAISQTLIESELFGHVKGAFTGANQDRIGLFEAARGGTLFLDELGELDPSIQTRLLRVLQEREIRRVGENKPRKIDVRLVAATNRNLETEVAAGRFREDLWFRLKVIDLTIPPLRDRVADIKPFANALLRRFGKRASRSLRGISPEALQILQTYHWPGNVRELSNVIERAVVLAHGPKIEAEDLSIQVSRSTTTTRPLLDNPQSETAKMTLAELEKHHIQAAIKRNGTNRVKAAAELGIGLATLYRKIKKYAAE